MKKFTLSLLFLSSSLTPAFAGEISIHTNVPIVEGVFVPGDIPAPLHFEVKGLSIGEKITSIKFFLDGKEMKSDWKSKKENTFESVHLSNLLHVEEGKHTLDAKLKTSHHRQPRLSVSFSADYSEPTIKVDRVLSQRIEFTVKDPSLKGDGVWAEFYPATGPIVRPGKIKATCSPISGGEKCKVEGKAFNQGVVALLATDIAGNSAQLNANASDSEFEKLAEHQATTNAMLAPLQPALATVPCANSPYVPIQVDLKIMHYEDVGYLYNTETILSLYKQFFTRAKNAWTYSGLGLPFDAVNIAVYYGPTVDIAAAQNNHPEVTFIPFPNTAELAAMNLGLSTLPPSITDSIPLAPTDVGTKTFVTRAISARNAGSFAPDKRLEALTIVAVDSFTPYSTTTAGLAYTDAGVIFVKNLWRGIEFSYQPMIFRLGNVLAHEMGHAYGLGHDNYDTTLSFMAPLNDTQQNWISPAMLQRARAGLCSEGFMSYSVGVITEDSTLQANRCGNGLLEVYPNGHREFCESNFFSTLPADYLPLQPQPGHDQAQLNLYFGLTFPVQNDYIMADNCPLIFDHNQNEVAPPISTSVYIDAPQPHSYGETFGWTELVPPFTHHPGPYDRPDYPGMCHIEACDCFHVIFSEGYIEWVPGTSAVGATLYSGPGGSAVGRGGAAPSNPPPANPCTLKLTQSGEPDSLFFMMWSCVAEGAAQCPQGTACSIQGGACACH